jgi:hypothetical protein
MRECKQYALRFFSLHANTRSLARLQEKQLQVGDVAHVIYGLIAALVGDKWADYEKEFSVREAVRLCIKFADYNKDGYMSFAESSVLAFPSQLFSALSPDGDHGHKVALSLSLSLARARSLSLF